MYLFFIFKITLSDLSLFVLYYSHYADWQLFIKASAKITIFFY